MTFGDEDITSNHNGWIRTAKTEVQNTRMPLQDTVIRCVGCIGQDGFLRGLPLFRFGGELDSPSAFAFSEGAGLGLGGLPLGLLGGGGASVSSGLRWALG